MAANISVKKRVILVNPGLNISKVVTHGIFPNTAIMILSTILKLHGIEVIVVDGNYRTPDQAVKDILGQVDKNLAFIGFSVMTIQLPWAYKVSIELKKMHPQIKIVWGGVHPTLFPEQVVEDGNVDIAVINDAASTIVSLTSAISKDEGLSLVRGICYRQGRDMHLTSCNDVPDDFTNVPEIDFEIINHRLYAKNNCVANEEYFNGKFASSTLYPIVTGLGCSYRCTFCINVILERKYKFRSANEIIERIKFLKNAYDADFIQLMDENFFISKKRIFEFVDLLEKENLRIKWRPQLRADYFNENYINVEFARRLERSGMVIAAMGVESASQKVLDMLRKQMKVEDISRAVKILSQTNIVPKLNFMVGLPGETEEEAKQTYDLACRIRRMEKRSYVSITVFRLYPGSLLYNKAVSDYGYLPPRSLKEWVENETSGQNFKNLGYGNYQQYSWIKNLKKFQARDSYYQYITFYNKRWEDSLPYKIFIELIYLRFKLDFFKFAFIDLYFINFAKWLRRKITDLIRRH